MKKFRLFLSPVLLLFVLPTYAAPTMATPVFTSVVSSTSCDKEIGQTTPFILALQPNEDVNQAILKCANEAQLSGASVLGVGTIKNPQLHYYDEKNQKNLVLSLQGSFELASLNGNIALENGKRVVHLHAVLSGQNWVTTAGHLDDGTVTALTEVTIIPMLGEVIRQYDPKTGFESLVAPTH